jgi:dCMP deaminase
MTDRITWDDYFMSLAKTSTTRSACLSRKVGAILVRDHRIIAIGYNGTPCGIPECQKCERLESGKELQDCRAIHAEENAILQCALYGSSTIGADLYSTLQPCFHCAKLIIQARIKAVYCLESYPDSRGIESLKEANIPVTQWREK